MRRVLVLLAAALVAMGCSHQNRAAKLAAELSARFRSEVPSRSPRVAVVAFLDKNHIDSHFDPSRREVGALMRDVDRTFPVRWDIRMTFQFDEDDRLVSYSIKPVGTGP
jgi:hypothetical protein